VKSAPQREQESREETAAEQFTPSRQNQDPSKKIDGVVIKEYKYRGHVNSPKRVAYDQTPPFGGPHDIVWATCNGNIYPEPVRTEHMVHRSEEHTSELQSRENLVCRLLLEKKKTKNIALDLNRVQTRIGP